MRGWCLGESELHVPSVEGLPFASELTMQVGRFHDPYWGHLGNRFAEERQVVGIQGKAVDERFRERYLLVKASKPSLFLQNPIF